MNEEPEANFATQRKLETVVQAGLALARERNLDALVQCATDAGRELCGAQFGAFFYTSSDEKGATYLLYTLSGVDRSKFANFPMPRSTQVFGPTFEGTGVVRSADITADPRYGKMAPHFGMPAGHLPVRSYLAVPVKARSGDVLGGMFFGHAEPDRFSQDAEDLVATVAVQAAIAIENVRLQEQLTRRMALIEELEAVRSQTAKQLAELAAIVRSSDDAILSKDLTGRIMTWNEAATRTFGFTCDEMVGESILKLIPPELQSEETVILQKISSGERIDHFETVRVNKFGERLDVSLSISPVRDATGTIVGASKILRNITDKKRLEASLLQAEKIAATGRMAATIAHEINNPLEAVVNLIFLAKQDATNPEQKSYLTAAEGEVARVSHIAKQTLGFYREHASARAVSISDMATDALKVYTPKCSASGIAVRSELHATRRIMARRGELMQVISNLIANAIYAMPEGGTLTLATDDLAGEDGVRLVVRDTGVGIATEQLPRIFEAFYTTRGAIGTGIGLFVARQFIEGHGGTIDVESSTDAAQHGTAMTIQLPLVTRYAGEGPAESAA